MGKRVKRLTMFKADHPWLAERREVLERLVAKDLATVRKSGAISVFPAVAAEELDDEEREVIYRLLGYEAPDADKPLIAKRAGVVGGRAAIAGTRIPVWQIIHAHREGATAADLRRMHGLSDEQIRQALAYAEAHPEEIERDIFDNEQVARLAGRDAA